jgi:hypothetical protein
LTLLLGLFCTFSQVSGALHWVLVEHERCSEHGELVHAGDSHGSDADAPPPLAVSITAEHVEGHAHEHCEFLLDSREVTLRPSSTASLLAPPLLGCFSHLRASDTDARFVLYELAPKTSPPARAS